MRRGFLLALLFVGGLKNLLWIAAPWHLRAVTLMSGLLL
jgi:hypothetical protein